VSGLKRHRVAATESTSEHRGLPPLRLAIPALIGAWAVAFEIPHLVALLARNPAATDFRLIYVAAQAGLTSGWAHMYDPGRLHQLSLAFGPSNAAITPSYTYDFPPLVAWLAAPLTAMPLLAAFYVWTVINLAAFLAAWWVASPATGFARVTVLMVSLAVWPTVFSVERGQPVLLAFALAIGCWWMAARRHEVAAGVLLALAWSIKPQDVALLPAVLILCGFRRAAAYWLLTSVILVAVYALVLGATGVGTYFGTLSWAATDPSFTATPLVTVYDARTTVIVSQVVLAALALAGVWRQRRSWNVAFAIGLVGTMLASVHLHEYDEVGLVVAAWLALGEPTAAFEIAWVAIGALCMQLPLIGIRLPIVLWQPIWLVMLALRRRSGAGVHKDAAVARTEAG